jgi:hypothetical protein
MPLDPTATKSGMLPWFQTESAFYREHAALFVGARPSEREATTTNAGVALTTMVLPSGAHVVHLINHNYEGGIVPQKDVEVTVPITSSAVDAAVTSPDPLTAARKQVATACDAAACRFTLPELESYAIVTIL